MIVRDFEWRESDNGWGWHPMFMGDAAGPSGLPAHDVLDHQPGDTPTLEQELMAFGRIAFRGGWRIGLELGEVLWQEHWNNCNRVKAPPRLVNLGRLDSGVRGVIERATIDMENTLWSECMGIGRGVDCEQDLIDLFNDATITPEEDQWVRSWLALGYLDAKRRFKDCNVASSTYDEINRQFQRHTFAKGDEGEQIRIRANLRRCSAEIIRSEFDADGRVFFPRQSRHD